MIHVAYSYLRFSTPEQAAGDSRRRQIAMAEKYAADPLVSGSLRQFSLEASDA
jgi:DNA invertase Pin-like site-specific DNA recombinase